MSCYMTVKSSKISFILGMYFCKFDKGEMASMVYNWESDAVDAVVVTDGSRVLGLGGAGSSTAQRRARSARSRPRSHLRGAGCRARLLGAVRRGTD